MLALWLLACQSAMDRGELALQRGDLLTAEQEFRAALADNPDNPEAIYGVGWTFHLAGERGAARDAFEQLAARFPESALGYRGLGSVLMAQGEFGAARTQFTLALQRVPNDTRTTQSFALLELAEGRTEDALRRIDSAIAVEPDSSELHQTRSAILLQMSRTDEALAAIESASQLADTPRAISSVEITRAKIIIGHASARVDGQHCDGVSAVLAWLDQADRTLDVAQATGVNSDQVATTRADLRRRRGFVEDACTGKGGGN
mgnify:CR=1 FL=1